MSFLLRNSKRSSNGTGRISQGPAPSSDSRILPRPRPTVNRGRIQSQHPTNPGVQSGNQFLIQRTVQKEQHVSQQQRLGTESKATKQAESQKQEQAQGVISMSEVLEDLRVLEQQQREAQRKLANARATKVHRVEQHVALESKLEHLKYSNGELRAQLRQSREILSCGTRALGARRLVSGRASDDIRQFERKLKKGLLSARMISASRRKIDSIFIVVENKQAVLMRLKLEAKEKLTVWETKMTKAQRSEGILRTSIQQEVVRGQKCAEDIATLRADNSESEKDLLAAQGMEESTKLRAEAVQAQIASETKRHDDAVSEATTQIDYHDKSERYITSEESLLAEEVQEKARELQQAKQRIREYQQDEGLHPNPPSADINENGPLFDRQHFEKSLEADGSNAKTKAAENVALRNSIEQLRSTMTKTEEDANRRKETAFSLATPTQQLKANEEQRREDLMVFQKELERDRAEVCKLEQSAKEFEEARGQGASRHTQLTIACDEAWQQAREEIKVAKLAIEAEVAVAEKDTAAWEGTKISICQHLDLAKNRANAAERALDDVEETSKKLDKDGESDFNQKMRDIDEAKHSHCEKTESQISKLAQKFPELENVSYTYDSTKSRKEQAEETLEGLVTEFESRVRAARESRGAKVQERAEARRRAEAAAAEVKRKEEERRKNRERVEAEIQRQEAEERKVKKERIEQEERFEEERRPRHAKIDDQAESDQDTEPFTESIGEETRWRSKTEGRSSKAAQSEGGGSFQASSNSLEETTRGKAKNVRKQRKGADFFFPQSQEVADEATPAQPKRLLSVFTGTDDSPVSKLILGISQSSDKRVRWEDEDDAGLRQEPDTPPKHDTEATSTTIPSRKKRPYGSSSKGLAAISRSKTTTKSPVAAKLSPLQTRPIGSGNEKSHAGSKPLSNEKQENRLARGQHRSCVETADPMNPDEITVKAQISAELAVTEESFPGSRAVTKKSASTVNLKSDEEYSEPCAVPRQEKIAATKHDSSGSRAVTKKSTSKVNLKSDEEYAEPRAVLRKGNFAATKHYCSSSSRAVTKKSTSKVNLESDKEHVEPPDVPHKDKILVTKHYSSGSRAVTKKSTSKVNLESDEEYAEPCAIQRKGKVAARKHYSSSSRAVTKKSTSTVDPESDEEYAEPRAVPRKGKVAATKRNSAGSKALTEKSTSRVNLESDEDYAEPRAIPRKGNKHYSSSSRVVTKKATSTVNLESDKDYAEPCAVPHKDGIPATKHHSSGSRAVIKKSTSKVNLESYDEYVEPRDVPRKDKVAATKDDSHRRKEPGNSHHTSEQRTLGSAKDLATSKQNSEKSLKRKQKSISGEGACKSSQIRADPERTTDNSYRDKIENRKPKKEAKPKRQERTGEDVIDSMAVQKKSPGMPKSKRSSSSTSRSSNATSRPSGSRSVASESTRSRQSAVATRKPGASRKRKSSSASTCTQASGLSSCEGALKARRRKKKDTFGSQKSTARSITDDAYAFNF